MAQVAIDISEYDALREAKAKAEQEAKELKETIKDLKKGSKVIFQTKYVRGDVNAATRYIRNRCTSVSLTDHLIISKVLEHFFGGEPRDTFQYINFKDVEAQVEVGISEQKKKELEDSIEYYKKAAQEYETKNAGLEEEYQKKLEADKNASKFFLEKKDKEIQALNDRITELSKSRDERIAELVSMVDKAEAELSTLKYKRNRNNWFNRMFK